MHSIRLCLDKYEYVYYYLYVSRRSVWLSWAQHWLVRVAEKKKKNTSVKNGKKHLSAHARTNKRNECTFRVSFRNKNLSMASMEIKTILCDNVDERIFYNFFAAEFGYDRPCEKCCECVRRSEKQRKVI